MRFPSYSSDSNRDDRRKERYKHKKMLSKHGVMTENVESMLHKICNCYCTYNSYKFSEIKFMSFVAFKQNNSRNM